MKSFLTSLSIILLFSNTIIAQDIFENYKSIESSGKVPAEFVEKSSEKVESTLDDFTSGEKGKTKRYKEDFLISSTFSTKKVLLSGKVLFNDPVTNYINKVANEIFKSNPKLDKNDFRIYAYKSPIVNAFAFNDGLVLVNLGMMAQLENEAQLALILCHEFTHVVNNDAIESFLSSKDIDNGSGIYRNISYDDKMLYKSKYSQELESIADMQGLGYFKKTKYSLKPINGVFDVLKYSYLPFDDIPFDTTYFEKGTYVFPTEYTLKEINPISPDGLEDVDEEDEDDVLKTHPGAEERREAILEKISIAELKDESKKVYLSGSEEEFKEIRNISRFEMTRMYLLYGYYSMSFYSAYLLEKQGFEDNLFLDKQKALALGQMARNVNNGNRASKSRLKEIENEMQGESQQVYYFLNTLSRKKKEFNVFAVEYTYRMLLKHPKDEELKTMLSDLLYKMFEETNVKFSDFKEYYAGSHLPEVDNMDSIAVESADAIKIRLANEKSEKEKLMDEIRDKDSKYNKIEKKVKEQQEFDEKVENGEIVTEKSKAEYYLYAFVNYMNDKSFTEEAKDVQKAYKKEKNKELSKEEKKLKYKNDKFDRNRGQALAIDKIVVVNPIYIVIKNDDANLIKSEKAQEDYNNLLDKLAKRAKIELETIDVNNLEENATETITNATILSEWISEQFVPDDPLNFSSIESEKIQRLKNTYGTSYFLWTGVISLQNKKHTLLFNLLYDIEKNEVLLQNYKDVRYVTNKNIIKSELYHVFDQIKTKRKTK